MVKTVQVLVKLPPKLLQRIDEIVFEEGYASRQEFIRELIRERVRGAREIEMVEEITRRRKVRVGGRCQGHSFPAWSSSASKGCPQVGEDPFAKG